MRHSAMGRESDDELAEAGGRFGAVPESPSQAIELWEGERAAPMVHLGLEYDTRPAPSWKKWGILAALAALVVFTGNKAVGR